MTKTHFVLKSVTDFAPGAFENTVLEEGSIQLGRGGGGYLPAGTYTSAPFTPPTFTRLLPSWNADTPPGTAIEVAVRFAAGGRWSRWFSFGRWSPFIDRACPAPVKNEMARAEGEMLYLAPNRAGGDTAQLRVSLYTNDASISPAVRLLALSSNGERGRDSRPPVGERKGNLPAYSCLVREPSIAPRIAGATSFAMMMNRWGEDVLPEEVARAAYDGGSARFGNLSFLCALAGAYSYECHCGFFTLEDLRREVWQGHAVGARVRYKAPSLGQAANEEAAQPEEAQPAEEIAAPVLEGASMDSSGHVLVVTGFETQDGAKLVLLNDPLALTDEAARRRVPLEQFEEIYTGVGIVLRKGPRGAGSAKPVRITSQLQLGDGVMRLSVRNKPLVEGDGSPYFRTTACYTLSDGVAYASAAQKKFYYPQPEEDGALRFDKAAATGKKLTFYSVGPLGTTWVAEKRVPAPGGEDE